MCQQVIEKILQACATMKTEDFPPRIHNLARLAELAVLDMTEEEGGCWNGCPYIIFRAVIHPKSRPWRRR
jgi:hypothetical protein